MSNKYSRTPSDDFGDTNGIRRDIGYLSDKSTGFHWVILRSAHLDGFCDCINESPRNYEYANPSCRRCLGTGRLYTDFFIKGLQYTQTRRFKGEEIVIEAGELRNAVFRYALTTDYKRPKQDDLLLELFLNMDDGQPSIPLRIKEVYNVEHVRDMIGDEGRIEFYSLIASKRVIMPGTFRRGAGDVNS